MPGTLVASGHGYRRKCGNGTSQEDLAVPAGPAAGRPRHATRRRAAALSPGEAAAPVAGPGSGPGTRYREQCGAARCYLRRAAGRVAATGIARLTAGSRRAVRSLSRGWRERQMARAIWSGVLSFGLVAIPVELYSATESHRPAFHQFEEGTGDRIRYQRVNERTGDEVGYDDIVKGADAGGGNYVMLDQDELDSVAPGRSRSLDIHAF